MKGICWYSKWRCNESFIALCDDLFVSKKRLKRGINDHFNGILKINVQIFFLNWKRKRLFLEVVNRKSNILPVYTLNFYFAIYYAVEYMISIKNHSSN